MRQALAKFILLTVWGWKIETEYPKAVKSSVVIVLPHTSYWDFPIGILIRPVMHLNTQFVAKHSLFKFPLGSVMRSLGGVPVNRSKTINFVDSVVAIFKKNENFILTIAPEGTRQKVDKIKRGFYQIALKSGVPIVCCKFDWGTKTIGFSQPFYPTGDYEKDLPQILEYYKGVKGYHSEWTMEFGQ